MNFVQDLCEDLYELFKVNNLVLIIAENKINLKIEEIFLIELICNVLLQVSLLAVELDINRKEIAVLLYTSINL